MILLIGGLHWVYKGYKEQKLNPIVYRGNGYYKLIYEQRGKHSAYFDTINGVKVKIPWHWRRYLKKQKSEITYKYLIRDGVVAMSEHPIYIISINETLSLDYELKNGLKTTTSLSFINSISLFLVLPVIIILCSGQNLDKALKINQAFKNPNENSILLSSSEELNTMYSSNYIKIDKAWIYQYKRRFDFLVKTIL